MTTDRSYSAARQRILSFTGTVRDLPAIRETASGSAVCQHRDLTVCPSCVAVLGPFAVDVVGAWYVFDTLAEADEVRAAIA